MNEVSLPDICHGLYLRSTIDTLLVPNLGRRWNEVLLDALVRICFKFRVRHLILLDEVWGNEWLEIFETYSRPEESHPDLSCLVSITVGEPSEDHIFRRMIDRSRISRLVFSGQSDPSFRFQESMNGVFIDLAKDPLSHNRSIREIFFLYQDSRDAPGMERAVCPFEFIPHNWDKVALDGREQCREWINRNRIAWQRCRKASVILLGLRRFRKSRLSVLVKDLVGIIGRMIWESRGTAIWDEKEGA